MEACLLSLSRSAIETMVERGQRSGLALREMKSNIDRPLSAILTLNTIAHTVGATGVGAQAAIVFGSAAVGIASAVMTLLILVVSEIIPKTLGAVHAKRLAPVAALIIRGMIVVSLPLIIPLEWMNRLFRFNRHAEARFSRAELLATIRMGHKSGALRKSEMQIASNLMALSEVQLADVLTPRTVVFSLPESETVERALAEHEPIRFGRIPVYGDDPEHVTGYVARFDLHRSKTAGEGAKPLSAIAKPILAFPEGAPVGHVLEHFIRGHDHIALVVDEFGGMAGVVTLEDLLETLLGEEIVDESDTVEDMRELARKRRERRKGIGNRE